MQDDVIEIDLQELMGLLLHRLWIIILAVFLTSAVGFGLSAFVIDPKYESTTSIYVLNRQNGETLTYSDAQLSTQLTKDYEELIISRHVLEQVMEEYGIEEEYERFAKNISVENKTDTRIIAITVKDEDPYRAQKLANEIRDMSAEHIQSVTDVEAVNVVDEANLPQEPAEPSVILWTAVGGMIGFVLCVGILIVRYLTDDTIKSSDDIEKYLELSTLALIPDKTTLAKKKGQKKKAQKSKPESVSIERQETDNHAEN